MPPRKQPATLLALCHCSVASHLASTCRMLQVAAQECPAAQVLALARRKLRPRFLSALPGSVRAELLERASRLLAAPAPDGGAAAGSGPAPLYLLALLLAPDVRYLRVELCCYYGCSHQAALLRLLAAEGAGLRSLELARSALLRLDRSLLRAALTSATGLRRLVLRNIAGDAVLQVVGACCPVLEVLDVAHSRQVTDTGLRGLLVNVELRDKEPGGELEATSPPAASWIKLRLLSRLVPWLRGEGRHSSGKRGDSQRVLLQYCERSTALCRTLVTLDVTNTGVTSGGILLALHHAPSLQSLGEYVHTGRAFEVLERARTSSTSNVPDPASQAAPAPNTFRLVSARSCRTTPRRLELLQRCCPSLRSLVLVEPRLPAWAIRLLPENLTSLGLRSTPADSALITALYSYLQGHGSTLTELTLSFANPVTQGSHDDPALLPLLDLAQVVDSCPKLRNLAVDNAAVKWGEAGIVPQHQHTCLRTVQLGRVVAANAVTALLAWAPELRVLHLHSSPDLSSQHLGHITKHSQNLECFYVYEARHVTSAAAVNALLSSCKQLLRLGNLANWGLDCDGTRAVHSVVRANNLQLELNSGAHWFSSTCVRGFS